MSAATERISKSHLQKISCSQHFYGFRVEVFNWPSQWTDKNSPREHNLHSDMEANTEDSISKRHPYVRRDSTTDLSNTVINPQALLYQLFCLKGGSASTETKKIVRTMQWCHTNSWGASITLSTTNNCSPLRPAVVTEPCWAHPGELPAYEGCWVQPSTPRCHPWLFRAPALLYPYFTRKHSAQSTYSDSAGSVLFRLLQVNNTRILRSGGWCGGKSTPQKEQNGKKHSTPAFWPAFITIWMNWFNPLIYNAQILLQGQTK